MCFMFPTLKVLATSYVLCTIGLVALAAAPAALARYIDNSINVACRQVFDNRLSMYQHYEPAARLEAYLECTARKLIESRQAIEAILIQAETEMGRRSSGLSQPCSEEAMAFDGYRMEAIGEFARIGRQVEDLRTLAGMVRNVRLTDVTEAQTFGTLHPNRMRVDPIPRVLVFNQQEAASTEAAVAALDRRARQASSWLGNTRAPACACRWVAESQLGLMHSRRFVCMCGSRFETRDFSRCGPPPTR